MDNNHKKSIRRINLYGGPNAGKSTTAAWLFSELKRKGYNVELVREYIKNWAYEGRRPHGWDGYYIFHKQLYAEARLLERNVDLIITDCPIPLAYCYTGDAKPFKRLMLETMLVFESLYPSLNIHLTRKEDSSYIIIGRYETLDEAKIRDESIINMLTNMKIEYFNFNKDEHAAMLNYIILGCKHV